MYCKESSKNVKEQKVVETMCYKKVLFKKNRHYVLARDFGCYVNICLPALIYYHLGYCLCGLFETKLGRGKLIGYDRRNVFFFSSLTVFHRKAISQQLTKRRYTIYT